MSGNFLAFTVPVSNNQIITDVWITTPVRVANVNAVKRTAFRALWDTGASVTCISPKIVEALKLIPVSASKMHTANGIKEAPMYAVALYLPNHVMVKHVKVAEFDASHGEFDVLVGMNLIRMGDFTVSGSGDKVIASFRTPSQGLVDYAEIKPIERGSPIVGRNSQCDCGSGKKYKKCCGLVAAT